MHVLTLAIVWAGFATFLAGWLFAMVSLFALMASDRKASDGPQGAFRWSTDMPGSSPAVVHGRRFMRGLAVGLLALTIAGVVGISSGALH